MALCRKRDKFWLEALIMENSTYNHNKATMVAVLVTLTPLIWDKLATSAGYASRLRWG